MLRWRQSYTERGQSAFGHAVESRSSSTCCFSTAGFSFASLSCSRGTSVEQSRKTIMRERCPSKLVGCDIKSQLDTLKCSLSHSRVCHSRVLIFRIIGHGVITTDCFDRNLSGLAIECCKDPWFKRNLRNPWLWE